MLVKLDMVFWMNGKLCHCGFLGQVLWLTLLPVKSNMDLSFLPRWSYLVLVEGEFGTHLDVDEFNFKPNYGGNFVWASFFLYPFWARLWAWFENSISKNNVQLNRDRGG